MKFSPFLFPVMLFSFCFQQEASGQDPDEFIYAKARHYDDGVVDGLKKTTTVFFYGSQSAASVDSLRNAILSVWDITPVIVDSYQNIPKYENSAYSLFRIEVGGYIDPHTKTFPRYYFTLTVPYEGVLCRTELYPDAQTINQNWDFREAYAKGGFYNWSPVLIMAQLQKICEDLKNNIRTGLLFSRKAGSMIEYLSQDTLYIAGSNLFEYNFPGREKKISHDIFKDYGFPYRICSDSELYDIFITQKRGRFLFEYVNSYKLKLITIYDCTEKDPVFRSNSRGKNLTRSDLKNIR